MFFRNARFSKVQFWFKYHYRLCADRATTTLKCFLRMELIKGLVNSGRLSKNLICLQTNAIVPLSQLTQSFLSSAYCYPSYSYHIVCSKMLRDSNSFFYYLSSNHLRALHLKHYPCLTAIV